MAWEECYPKLKGGWGWGEWYIKPAVISQMVLDWDSLGHNVIIAIYGYKDNQWVMGACTNRTFLSPLKLYFQCSRNYIIDVHIWKFNSKTSQLCTSG